jgi:secondary thiamine-phosphate synthase enzyme
VTTFTLTTERKTQLIDITAEVREALSGRRGSIVVVFVPHTTAGLVLQASGHGASAVASDVETAFEGIVDEGARWSHAEEGDRNPASHIRASLTASSVSIPLVGGDLALGTLQHVFLAEFDGPRERTVVVTVVA